MKNKLTTLEFIEKANKIHNNIYDYSLVEYTGNRNKIKIVCSKHGIFEQIPFDHLDGHGCSKCSHPSKKSTIEEFIEKANIIHDNKYNYSLVKYVNAHKKINIICKKHGEFLQKPNAHLCSQGCPICKNSKGEENIIKYLKENNVLFEYQKKFDDCKNNKYKLFFDFYLPNQNLLIEYDGEQHHKIFKHFGGNIKFEKTKLNDKLKTEYALNNNIKLLRIPYTEKKNLSEILKNNISILINTK
jgi:very-short-patch-repair endonuclease